MTCVYPGIFMAVNTICFSLPSSLPQYFSFRFGFCPHPSHYFPNGPSLSFCGGLLLWKLASGLRGKVVLLAKNSIQWLVYCGGVRVDVSWAPSVKLFRPAIFDHIDKERWRLWANQETLCVYLMWMAQLLLPDWWAEYTAWRSLISLCVREVV